jgi:heptosyltransferase-3
LIFLLIGYLAEVFVNILIFHIGSLGDTLISLPALWAIRDHYENARIIMFSDSQRSNHYVKPRDVLEGSGLIDEWLDYRAEVSWKKWRLIPGMIQMMKEMRRRRFDALVYLIQQRSWLQKLRDFTFFRFSGMKQFHGFQNFNRLAYGKIDSPLPPVPHQADQILSRLAWTNIPVPTPGNGNMDLRITDFEEDSIMMWRQRYSGSCGKPWVAVGFGSNMPAKRWPVERFETVVSRLIESHDIWPVIFGGSEDRPMGIELIKKWGRGCVAAGELGVRQGIAALKHCSFFLGNDTGTMHMAVASGIRCIALFSARDYPGLWYPYGEGHIIFRKTVACEGCMLEVCTENAMKCIRSIGVDEVHAEAEKLLETPGNHCQ